MIKENEEMSRYRLKIAYDGTEADGELDSDALAYALLALSNLFTEANSILNRAETNIKVKVKANIKKGSFEVCFDVVQSLIDHCLCFLSSEKNYSAQNIAAILGLALGTTSGLIKILVHVQGVLVKQ
jgi:hypothetical protein